MSPLNLTYNATDWASIRAWHSSKHALQRRETINYICKLLKSRKPDASVFFLQKIPAMALRLEKYLYSQADSFEMYIDRSTIKQRLIALASAFAGRPYPEGNRCQLAGVVMRYDAILVTQKML